MKSSIKKSKSPTLPYYKVVLYLSTEAQDYLSETTDNTSHYAILNQLIRDTSLSEATVTKRGNVIHLTKGQVECSINSFCQTMSLGRKAMERIIRDFERLGIIRLQRSRLATIADMLCISSWQLNDDSIVYNDLPLVLKDADAGDRPEREEAPVGGCPSSSESVSTPEVNPQSSANTVNLTPPVPPVSSDSDKSDESSAAGETSIPKSETQVTPTFDSIFDTQPSEIRDAACGSDTNPFGSLFNDSNGVSGVRNTPLA